jgi:hypothetical protein
MQLTPHAIAAIAYWVIGPQILVLAIVIGIALATGLGWSLALLLGVAIFASWKLAALAWAELVKRQNPPSYLYGALVGLCIGVLGAGTTYLALIADRYAGLIIGGSLAGEIIGQSTQAGFDEGTNAAMTGSPAMDVLTAPHRVIISLAGGLVGALLAIAIMLAAVVLPVPAGLAGGLVATWRARRFHSPPP